MNIVPAHWVCSSIALQLHPRSKILLVKPGLIFWPRARWRSLHNRGICQRGSLRDPLTNANRSLILLNANLSSSQSSNLPFKKQTKSSSLHGCRMPKLSLCLPRPAENSRSSSLYQSKSHRGRSEDGTRLSTMLWLVGTHRERTGLATRHANYNRSHWSARLQKETCCVEEPRHSINGRTNSCPRGSPHPPTTLPKQ